MNIGLVLVELSIRSVRSRASKLSQAGERLHNTEIVEIQAGLKEKQTELKKKPLWRLKSNVLKWK